ncbi:hypothetical protein F4808DRAFT_467673 [Astrocystis sublimbata]|nr:hypothetical protein F4808DRAFT_467673 [Astrocystis sublimbata]
MDNHILTVIRGHTAQMDAVFAAAIAAFVRDSKFSLTLLRINSGIEDSFIITMELRITRTGHKSVMVGGMTVDLAGPVGNFGRVKLPPFTTRFDGTEAVVLNQTVRVTDVGALKAFMRVLVMNKDVRLSLRNGETTIRTAGVSPQPLSFSKVMHFNGMEGPRAKIIDARILAVPFLGNSPSHGTISSNYLGPLNTSPTNANIDGTLDRSNHIFIKFSVHNPSPLETSFGTSFFRIQTHNGIILAELKGRYDVRRGHFEVTFRGLVNKPATGRFAQELQDLAQRDGRRASRLEQTPFLGAVLIGQSCTSPAWCDAAVKAIEAPISNLGPLFRALGIDIGTEHYNVRDSLIRDLAGRWHFDQ